MVGDIDGDMERALGLVGRSRAWDGIRAGCGSQGDGKGLVGETFWMEVHLLVFLQAWYPYPWL